MLLACTEEYNQCIKYLYALGYRIKLPVDDDNKIKQIMKLESISNKIHFWWVLVKGKEAPRENEYEREFERISTKEISRRKSMNKIFKKTSDDVERYLLLKAYSNPYYLVAGFKFRQKKFSSHENLEVRKILLEDSLPKHDPLRKSLAIARYSELLSIYDSEYSQEYSKIKKVGLFFITEVQLIVC